MAKTSVKKPHAQRGAGAVQAAEVMPIVPVIPPCDEGAPIPAGATCQEVVSVGGPDSRIYGLCGRPAEMIVRHEKDRRAYYFCRMCGTHNVRNRGGHLIRQIDAPPSATVTMTPAGRMALDPTVALMRDAGVVIERWVGDLTTFVEVAKAIEARAVDLEQQATTLRVTDLESDQAAVALARSGRAVAKEAEDAWAEITGATDRLHKATTNTRARAVTAGKNAVRLATDKHTRFEAEENRRREDERRQREEAQRQDEERRRQAEQARLELEALRIEESAPDLSARERRFVDEFVASGDQVRAARLAGYKSATDGARLMKLPKIDAAIEAARQALEVRRVAEAKRQEPIRIDPEPEPPRTSATASKRVTRSADILHESDFVRAILERYHQDRTAHLSIDMSRPPYNVLRIGQKEASAWAQSIGKLINDWPGVQLRETTTLL